LSASAGSNLNNHPEDIMKKFLNEFKNFAIRGSVIDLAVGIIIGSAFNNIVSSLVNNIVMPLLSIFIGRINIKTLSFTINPSILGMQPIPLPYGLFLQAVINFIIISFCIFLVINFLGKLHKKDPVEIKLTQSEELLTEIRDILKQNGNPK
jgi:large conductance mechanosensitive channel